MSSEQDSNIPIRRVHLNESRNFLLLRPTVDYNGQETNLVRANQAKALVARGKYATKERNAGLEDEFSRILRNLHPNFKQQLFNGPLHLTFDEVIENDWYFEAFDKLKEHNIEVLGFDRLKKVKYNPNRPKLIYSITSTDSEFLINCNVKFGEELVPLPAIEEILIKNKNTVPLEDGTLGLFPEKWIWQYDDLFKLGEVGFNMIKMSQLHFGIIDRVFGEVDDEETAKNIQIKKARSTEFNVENYPIPDNVKADLRDYQREAFAWMAFLDDFGWGGCLADDMGLGKTLQMLSFLQHKVNDNPNQVNLVVMPTSLVFNWHREITKFCPDLTYHIHQGSDRVLNEDLFYNVNIVLTSYSLMVKDIEFLQEIEFNYVILDESQNIKNPTSKRYKAAKALKAKNRMILSGTPIENNTFDLYAQVNFINPGLLGSARFFRKEFANPIDKEGNKNKVKKLQKIVRPFLLRRTKEQVAKELPSKTVDILYCEMSDKQRKVYDNVRAENRAKVMNQIHQDGLAKSGIYILDGMLKMRQVCDSPQLLKTTKKVSPDSVKIETLMEHILEKTSNHKILVFSQFVEMLKLIKKRLVDAQINHEYLDGSTRDREKRVVRFQDDDECRVFLLSLKAGGTGLNLTAADYIYIVDPWWNPAIEEQAIDRSHRIGQDKSVFAYKMICKDSIEEKVLRMQERKKSIADGVVSTDKSFLRSLSLTDIDELFS